MRVMQALDFETVEFIANSAPEYLQHHLDDVRGLARGWGEYLGLHEPESLAFEQAALLHDLGKLVIPERIVCKPMALLSAEMRVMQQHVRFGAQMIRGYVSDDVVTLVLQHHERIDGHGYPFGMSGEEILPLARRLSIVDAFSAMTEGRPYRETLSHERAVAELQRCAGTQFDASFVTEFSEWRAWTDR